MNEKPTLARAIYTTYVNEHGEVAWPEDRQERRQLARVLYGRQTIHTFDYWLKHILDFIKNPHSDTVFPRKNEPYKKDLYFREGLSTLSSQQKQVVWHLMRELAHGLMFSSLVDLDQSSYGEYAVALKPKGEEDVVHIVPDPPTELHDEFNDWILSFSEFADELVELVEIPGGWELRRKACYHEDTKRAESIFQGNARVTKM